MMEEEKTEYIIKTTSKEEAMKMLKASSMQCAIDCYYDDVLRKYYKHPDSHGVTDEQHEFLERIMEELKEHFEHLQSI